MDIEKFRNGLRDRKLEKEIKQQIKKSKYYKKGQIKNAEILPLYKTREQQTYLVKTEERIYKVLDDRRKKNLQLDWSMNNEKIKNKKYQILIKEQDKDTYEFSVVTDKGQKKNFYSKKIEARGDNNNENEIQAKNLITNFLEKTAK